MSEKTFDVIVFPLAWRVGKIRAAASKMMERGISARPAQNYENQITTSLLSNLKKLGVPATAREKQIVEFWSAVQEEISNRMREAGAA
jgi:hypothetical protein